MRSLRLTEVGKAILVLAMLLSIALIIYFSSPPITKSILGISVRGVMLASYGSILLIFFLGFQLSTTLKPGWLAPLFTLALLPWLIYLTDLSLPTKTLATLIMIFAALWGIFMRRERDIQGSGLLSLVLTLSSLLLLELTLLSFSRGELVAEVAAPKRLVPLDQGLEAYRKIGFRGKRACVRGTEGCPKDLYRIVTIGGSSVYGVPMVSPSSNFSAFLNKFLNQGSNERKYEVLNAGIAGYGVMQIIDSLRRVVIPTKPDMVIVSTWYNDATAQPGWYGIPGKSDKEAYEFLSLLAKIEEVPGFKRIFYSRTISLLRFYLGEIRRVILTTKSTEVQTKKKKRMNPDEFRWGLEEIVSLSKENNFKLVFVTEALNHSFNYEDSLKRQRYYREMDEVGRQFHIPIVDTLTPLSKRREEWLFYDFIHPNVEGHLLIAEEIYNQLFEKPAL